MLRLYLSIGLLVVRFSACVSPPQMTKYFDYATTPEQAYLITKAMLDSMGYEIDWLVPESRLIITAPRKVAKDIRRYDYRLVVQVTDLLEVTIIARRHIFNRGSEWSLGGKAMTGIDPQDRIPYSLQQKIYFPLIDAFQAQGLYEFDRKRGIRIFRKPPVKTGKSIDLIPVRTTN